MITKSLPERDAAASEFGFAESQMMEALGRDNDEHLLRLYTNLCNAWARYLEAQDVYLAESILTLHAHHEQQLEEVRQRLASR